MLGIPTDAESLAYGKHRAEAMFTVVNSLELHKEWNLNFVYYCKHISHHPQIIPSFKCDHGIDYRYSRYDNL